MGTAFQKREGWACLQALAYIMGRKMLAGSRMYELVRTLKGVLFCFVFLLTVRCFPDMYIVYSDVLLVQVALK